MSSCYICGVTLKSKNERKCKRCRVNAKDLSHCPSCGRRSRSDYLKAFKICAKCQPKDREVGRILTGEPRKRAIERFITWLENNLDFEERFNNIDYKDAPIAKLLSKRYFL
jgi:predicted amidophosphoribosyltransferase